MGNKRQRLARKKFKVVTGDHHQNDDGESKERHRLEARSNADGALEAPSNGQVKKKTGKKRKIVSETEVHDVDGENASYHQNAAAAAAAAVTGPELLEGKGLAADDTTIEEKVLGQDGAQKKDEKNSKKPGSKHPLRMPGMKPGEGCFLCKGTDHIAKFCPTKSARDRKKICLLCRAIGHTLKNCPTSFETQEAKFCYNCGENGHRLFECKKPLKDGGTAFAECFVCKQKGHISKHCPTNPHGVYPKGGCCKLCGGVTHLAKDCPTKKSGGRMKLQISTSAAQASEPGGGGRRTVFKSGDDLEDDFVLENEEANTIGTLSFGSDDEDEATENRPEPMTEPETHPRKKLPKNKTADPPCLAGSTKKTETTKIIKFQRPK